MSQPGEQPQVPKPIIEWNNGKPRLNFELGGYPVDNKDLQDIVDIMDRRESK